MEKRIVFIPAAAALTVVGILLVCNREPDVPEMPLRKYVFFVPYEFVRIPLNPKIIASSDLQFRMRAGKHPEIYHRFTNGSERGWMRYDIQTRKFDRILYTDADVDYLHLGSKYVNNWDDADRAETNRRYIIREKAYEAEERRVIDPLHLKYMPNGRYDVMEAKLGSPGKLFPFKFDGQYKSYSLEVGGGWFGGETKHKTTKEYYDGVGTLLFLDKPVFTDPINAESMAKLTHFSPDWNYAIYQPGYEKGYLTFYLMDLTEYWKEVKDDPRRTYHPIGD